MGPLSWIGRGMAGEFCCCRLCFFQACAPPKVRAMTLLLLSDCACCSNKARTLFPDTVYTSILRGLSGAVGVTAKGKSSTRVPVFPPLPVLLPLPVLPPFPVLPFSPLHQASRPPGPSPSLQQPRAERDLPGSCVATAYQRRDCTRLVRRGTAAPSNLG